MTEILWIGIGAVVVLFLYAARRRRISRDLNEDRLEQLSRMEDER